MTSACPILNAVVVFYFLLDSSSPCQCQCEVSILETAGVDALEMGCCRVPDGRWYRCDIGFTVASLYIIIDFLGIVCFIYVCSDYVGEWDLFTR